MAKDAEGNEVEDTKEQETELSAEELAEKAAADLAEGNKKTLENNEEKKDTSAEAVSKAINELKEALKPGMTAEQREAAIKGIEDESGVSRKTLMFFDKQISEASINANIDLYRELGRGKAEKALGALSDQLIADVEAEMAKLPAKVQANPKAWEDLAYLIKGKKIDQIKTNNSGKPDTKVEGGKVKGLSEGGRGSGSGGAGDKNKKKYDADETQMITRYFGGNAEEYEKRKADKRIGYSKQETPASGNAADKELARLTGGVTG